MTAQVLKKVNFYKNSVKKNIFFSKKIYFFFIFSFFLYFFISIFIFPAFSTNVNGDLENDLMSQVNFQLNEIDLSSLQEILNNLEDSQKELFGNTDILEKLKGLISSEQELDFNQIFSSIISIFFNQVLGIIPILATICAIAILSNIVGNLRLKNSDKSIGDIIHFVCYGLIIVLVSGTLLGFMDMTKQTIFNLQAQMQIIFPILLTLTTAIGGTVSVGIFQPAMAILTNFIVGIFIWIVFPIFICNFIFNVVGNLSSSIKLDKFSSFFSSSFKWVVGIIFSLFTTFLTFQGISAGSYDGLSIKSAKYAIKSYVPFVGNYLSDGFNLILSSSVLIKNAVGVVGLILLCATIMLPVVKIVILGLGLKLVSAIIEPIADKRISSFVFGISKTTNYLVAIILSVSFMYLIAVGLIMCTSNLIV